MWKEGKEAKHPVLVNSASIPVGQWIKLLKRNCSDGTIWVIIGKRIYLNFLVFEQNLCHVYTLNIYVEYLIFFQMMRMDKIYTIFLESAWLLLLSLKFRESVWWCDWGWFQGLMGLTTGNCLERIRKYGLVEGGVSQGAGFEVPKTLVCFFSASYFQIKMCAISGNSQVRNLHGTELGSLNVGDN